MTLNPLASPLMPTFLLMAAPWMLTGCETGRETPGSKPPEVSSLDAIAESYVRLVLAIGQHDADYVDAFYGPEEWRAQAGAEERSLDELKQSAAELMARLPAATPEPADDEMVTLRYEYLSRQLEALTAHLAMLAGERWTFDEESRALYDAAAPRLDGEHFETLIGELEGLLAAEGYAEGTFTERYKAFRSDFVIPPEKLDEVFQAAIAACKERTAAHIELPEGETFTVEYVTDKSWSGYNWYQGEYRSLIQVNTDLPIYIDRAIDLACHEGYPGHHLYNALLEKHLTRGRGWVEFSVYPLFSPQSLIAEGSANYGIEMSFPGKERWRFESETLFPLAGLDPSRAETYYRIQGRVSELGYAGNEAARRYLDGETDAEGAAEWLVRYAAMEPERARQRVGFIDQYRSYVINYNLGEDLVRRHVEILAGNRGDAQRGQVLRWQIFAELLGSPRLPSGLVSGGDE